MIINQKLLCKFIEENIKNIKRIEFIDNKFIKVVINKVKIPITLEFCGVEKSKVVFKISGKYLTRKCYHHILKFILKKKSEIIPEFIIVQNEFIHLDPTEIMQTYLPNMKIKFNTLKMANGNLYLELD